MGTRVISFKEVGPPNTPQEIKRLRRQNMDACRRLGQPVVFRHMWNRNDVENGLAKLCPSCYDDVYEQVRNDCAVCYGVGYVSIEDDPNLWITTTNTLVTSDPGTGIHAPLYGGFDQPYLTWMMEPDVAVDVFRITEQGVMVRTYDAQGVAPWYPKLGDNDLCINVEIESDNSTALTAGDRFQLKMTQQVTVRGFGIRSNRIQTGSPQSYMVAQTFQMSHIPANTNNILEKVPIFNVASTDLAIVSGSSNISGSDDYIAGP